MKYVLVGRTTKDALSYKGKILVHDSAEELQFLFPNERVAPLPSYVDDSLTMALKDHPDMQTVQFPLNKHWDQFRK
jgi:hypothetical protein